jgi:hypothetical protein
MKLRIVRDIHGIRYPSILTYFYATGFTLSVCCFIQNLRSENRSTRYSCTKECLGVFEELLEEYIVHFTCTLLTPDGLQAGDMTHGGSICSRYDPQISLKSPYRSFTASIA